jgi:hypothetical protein
VRFSSFLSGGFITAIVVNPPERKLAKHTSVQCREGRHKSKSGRESRLKHCSKLNATYVEGMDDLSSRSPGGLTLKVA